MLECGQSPDIRVERGFGPSFKDCEETQTGAFNGVFYGSLYGFGSLQTVTERKAFVIGCII